MKYSKYAPFAAAAIFIIPAAIMFITDTRKRLYGLEAKAKIIELVEKNNRGRSFAPKFEFTASDKKQYTVVYTRSANPPQYKVGDNVTVYYFDSDPEGAILDDGTYFTFIPAVFFLAGLLAIFVVKSAFLRMRNGS